MTKVSPTRDSNNNPVSCLGGLTFYLFVIVGIGLVLKAWVG